jgi:hypothetical protein
MDEEDLSSVIISKQAKRKRELLAKISNHDQHKSPINEYERDELSIFDYEESDLNVIKLDQCPYVGKKIKCLVRNSVAAEGVIISRQFHLFEIQFKIVHSKEFDYGVGDVGF